MRPCLRVLRQLPPSRTSSSTSRCGTRVWVRRLFTIYRHVLGLSFGGLAAYVRSRPRRASVMDFKFWSLRLTSTCDLPFRQQKTRSAAIPGAASGKASKPLGPDERPTWGRFSRCETDVLPLERSPPSSRTSHEPIARTTVPALYRARCLRRTGSARRRDVHLDRAGTPMGPARSIGQTHRATTLDAGFGRVSNS